jgi:hypothetical protein
MRLRISEYGEFFVNNLNNRCEGYFKTIRVKCYCVNSINVGFYKSENYKTFYI